MSEIRTKVDELIILLNDASRKSDAALSELALIETRRATALKQIEDAEKRIVNLKDINSSLNTKLRDDRNEAERLVNINKGKQVPT